LIIGRISGYGQTGPYASRPGFGTLAEAMSGFTYKNGHPGGPPTNPPLALADMVAGVHQENRQVLNRIIGDWIRSKTLKEVLEECERAEVTIGPLYNMKDIANDPHVKERGSVSAVYDPASGRTLSMPAVPIRLLQTPGEIRFPGLPMGSANEVIYQDLLGYSVGEIHEMAANGVI
jgi:crotonobetainyl-CoA:carnitine CoA-transferase CaiB-like acyl-CoA transferase